MKKTLGIGLISLMLLTGCGEEAAQVENGAETTMSTQSKDIAITDAVGTSGESMAIDANTTQPEASEKTTPVKTPPPPTPAAETTPSPLLVSMSSGNMFFNPNKVTAQVNQKVTINFSNSGFHTFVIDALGVEVDLKGKDTATITFTPTKKGTFEFYCDVPGHKAAGMFGTLVVE